VNTAFWKRCSRVIGAFSLCAAVSWAQNSYPSPGPVIVQDASGSAQVFIEGSSGGWGAEISSINNAPLSFRANGAFGFAVDTNGRVGIGTLTPAVPFDIESGQVSARFGQYGKTGYIQFENGTGGSGFQPTIGVEQGSSLALALVGTAGSDNATDLPAVLIDGRNSGGRLANRHCWVSEAMSGESMTTR